METDLKSIESQCGIAPKNVSFEEIASNPNYVFKNDPSYETIILYDADGNVVNVNSWIECAHYVNGGWNNISSSNFPGDKLIFSGLLVATFIYVVLKKRYLANVEK
tara:strand:+ start:2999 stop:3316 length:318 start_codon:yes stop_codon:yes gene_type:complete